MLQEQAKKRKSNGLSTQFMQEVKLRLNLKNVQDLKVHIKGYSVLREHLMSKITI